MLTRISVVRADITTLSVDAIVNAANSALCGGGGVDGAIHRAAGPELLAACRGLTSCEAGDARITRGFRLPAGYVIHAVGPVWHGGDAGEAETLARCHTRALELAVEHGARSVAFPAISCGVYRFPVHLAAPTAVGAANRFLSQTDRISRVVFAMFDSNTERAFEEALADLGASGHAPST